MHLAHSLNMVWISQGFQSIAPQLCNGSVIQLVEQHVAPIWNDENALLSGFPTFPTLWQNSAMNNRKGRMAIEGILLLLVRELSLSMGKNVASYAGRAQSSVTHWESPSKFESCRSKHPPGSLTLTYL